MSKPSPYPPALVARVSDPHEDMLGAVLVPRAMGYLIVCIYFHSVPVEGLEVSFYVSNDGEKGDPIGETVATLEDGIARVEMLVPAVDYVCEIQDQELTVVTTTHDLGHPCPLVLPIGRPFSDMDQGDEFELESC